MDIQVEVGDRVTINGKSQYLADGTVGFCEEKITKVERIGKNGWYTIYEKKENKELLTDEEREFLKLVLKFMNTEIKYITKKINWNGGLEMVFCVNEDGSGAGYWYYIKNSYFKNLEEGKGYTLSELGLED